MNLDTVLHHYAICALWSSVDDEGEPLDDDKSVDDIAPSTMKSMREDCEDFITANAKLLKKSGLSDEQIGHDFWLTRNGHGAGFWDRGFGKTGEKISDAARVYGEVYLYIGDDGLIYG